MLWNVQRAGATDFRLSFDAIIQCYNLSTVVMFEPRISGQKADNFIWGCGFKRSYKIEAVGFSGGIWILWRDFITVKITLNHKQFVHFKIISSNGLESWVTAVYASPIPTVWRELWYHLANIASQMMDPWLVGGDFNAILCAHEKKGGSN